MVLIYEEEIFKRYVGRNVLLDSNLLLLYVSVSVDVRLLDRFKRISDFTIRDYEMLVKLLRSFRILVYNSTHPH